VPSVDQHLAKARAHWDFSEWLLGRASDDRALGAASTYYFYAAVHLVEAYLATRSIHSSNHADRRRRIRAEGALRALWPAYKVLEDVSREDRYGVTWMRSPEEVWTEVRNYCRRMENAIFVALRSPSGHLRRYRFPET
jgi:hypothetical protein